MDPLAPSLRRSIGRLAALGCVAAALLTVTSVSRAEVDLERLWSYFEAGEVAQASTAEGISVPSNTQPTARTFPDQTAPADQPSDGKPSEAPDGLSSPVRMLSALASTIPGAAPPTAGTTMAIPEGATCEALYHAVTALLPLTRRRSPGFLDNPMNAAIGAVGLIFPPAFYAWMAPRIARLGTSTTSPQDVQLQVNALRQRLAKMNCFVGG